MSADSNASASSTPPPPPRFERGKTYYLKYVGKRKYMGEDPGDKTIGFDSHFVSVHPGDIVEVSSQKAKQLLRDFKNEWQPSNEAAYEKSQRDQQEREEKAAVLAKQQYQASVEREKRERTRTARAGAHDPEDDEED